MKKTALFLASACVAAALVLPSIGVGQSNPLMKLEGKPAPAFKMKSTTGQTLTNASLKGKVVLLDFWATWCGPCKAASPTMEALHKKYGKQGLVVVGANTFEHGGDPKTAATGYKKEHGYTYTFTYGNDAFAQGLGIRGIPAFIFIGKDGKIAKTVFGFSDQAIPVLESISKSLLAK